ncbi:hypothetical protein [Vibrio sp. TRT 29B02]|uniref:hypothetical protein n=1 Tax=Vibrio sp. TRT 29B02 TaxID=3418508 RepID=UPI003CE7DB5A
MSAALFRGVRYTTLLSLALSLINLAYALPAPKSEPVLWVSGNITQSNSNQGVVFDEEMLLALEQGSIMTNNHVVEQIVEYTGPKLVSVLDYVGAEGETLKVVAWDDYVVTISIADAEKYGLLLATHEAGKRMTIDDKGPFFIVYPFSENPELRNDYYYSLSVWQVKELVIE